MIESEGMCSPPSRTSASTPFLLEHLLFLFLISHCLQESTFIIMINVDPLSLGTRKIGLDAS